MVCAWWAFRIGNVDDIDRKMMHAAVEHLIRPGYQVADLLATIDCYYSWQCDRARFSFKPFARWARYDSPVPWLYRACDENDYRRGLDTMGNQRVPLQSPATVRSLDVPDARARRREALPILFGTGLACRGIGREPPGNRPFRLESGAGVSHGRDYFRAASKAGSSAEADVRSGLVLQFFDVFQKLLFAGQAGEIETDHLIRSQRRLFAGPQGDQQTGDDRQVGLDFDAVFTVTDQMPTAQDMFEEPEEYLDGPTMFIDQGDDIGRHVQDGRSWATRATGCRPPV